MQCTKWNHRSGNSTPLGCRCSCIPTLEAALVGSDNGCMATLHFPGLIRKQIIFTALLWTSSIVSLTQTAEKQQRQGFRNIYQYQWV